MELGSNYRIDANFRWLGSELKEKEELCLTVCGIERCRPDKSYGPTVREDYHVHVILRGKGVLEMNRQTYRLGRGEIFVIPPETETFYYADPKDPWCYTWLSFAGTRASFFLERAGLTQTSPVRNAYLKPEEYLTITEKILDHHELTASNELKRTSLLYEFLALLIDSQNQNLSPGQRGEVLDYAPEIYVNAALEYIHRNYSHIRIKDIADYIGISRYYLTHLFREKMQVSPQEYLLCCRMEESSRLLLSTALPVHDIAEKVGYENPLTFSKAFKKYYGVSPLHYRQSKAFQGQ